MDKYLGDILPDLVFKGGIQESLLKEVLCVTLYNIHLTNADNKQARLNLFKDLESLIELDNNTKEDLIEFIDDKLNYAIKNTDSSRWYIKGLHSINNYLGTSVYGANEVPLYLNGLNTEVVEEINKLRGIYKSNFIKLENELNKIYFSINEGHSFSLSCILDSMANDLNIDEEQKAHILAKISVITSKWVKGYNTNGKYSKITKRVWRVYAYEDSIGCSFKYKRVNDYREVGPVSADILISNLLENNVDTIIINNIKEINISKDYTDDNLKKDSSDILLQDRATEEFEILNIIFKGDKDRIYLWATGGDMFGEEVTLEEFIERLPENTNVRIEVLKTISMFYASKPTKEDLMNLLSLIKFGDYSKLLKPETNKGSNTNNLSSLVEGIKSEISSNIWEALEGKSDLEKILNYTYKML